MKLLIILLSLIVSLPAMAEMTTPVAVSVLSTYTNNNAENSRRAIRLGYQNFCARINTPDMTANDRKIVHFIHDDLQPYLDKLNTLLAVPEEESADLFPTFYEELQTLVIQLTKLLLKNQLHYINPLFLEDQAAIQETLHIIQEAIDKGGFC